MRCLRILIRGAFLIVAFVSCDDEKKPGYLDYIFFERDTIFVNKYNGIMDKYYETVMVDSFENNNFHWPVTSNSQYSVIVSNGILVLNSYNYDYFNNFLKDSIFPTTPLYYEIEVNLQLSMQSGYSMSEGGLIWSRESGFYYFLIRRDNSFNLGYYDGGWNSFTDYRQLYPLNLVGDFHKIMIRRYENRFYVFFDESLAYTSNLLTDDEYNLPGIGFGADRWATIECDWIRVKRILKPPR
ncbi:MAG: hypothetical protein NTU44_05160 [Bacteroidetes bacterium]|nr:hypothetical protein [Bacteroidota bacterium]